MTIRILTVIAVMLIAAVACAEGPIATDTQSSGLVQTIKLHRQSNGTMPNRCDTLAAAGTVVYAIGNTSAITISATDSGYNGVTVLRSWDSDTATMPVFSKDTLVPGSGIKTITVTNVSGASAIVCIERQVSGDQGP